MEPMEETLGEKYERLVEKWIDIYVQAFDADENLKPEARKICRIFPVGYGKPQVISLSCIWAASKRIGQEIPVNDLISFGSISAGSFWKFRKFLKQKNVI